MYSQLSPSLSRFFLSPAPKPATLQFVSITHAGQPTQWLHDAIVSRGLGRLQVGPIPCADSLHIDITQGSVSQGVEQLMKRPDCSINTKIQWLVYGRIPRWWAI